MDCYGECTTTKDEKGTYVTICTCKYGHRGQEKQWNAAAAVNAKVDNDF